MATREIKKGQLVRSRAGRDKDIYYLIYDWDYDYVYLVDGNRRRLQNPKKKNLLHLWFSEKIAEDIHIKLSSQSKVTNADLREALAKLIPKVDTEEGGQNICLRM